MPDKRPSTRYSPEEVERGLFALAVTGDSVKARKQLAAQGLSIPDRTLRTWKETQYADRFREIAANHTREIRDTIAQEQIEIAIAAGDVERAALAKVHSQIKDADLKDVSTAGRNAAVSKGIALDKHLLYRGEPTSIVQHRQAADILAQIKKAPLLCSSRSQPPHNAWALRRPSRARRLRRHAPARPRGGQAAAAPSRGHRDATALHLDPRRLRQRDPLRGRRASLGWAARPASSVGRAPPW